jgi:hypothetical protein
MKSSKMLQKKKKKKKKLNCKALNKSSMYVIMLARSYYGDGIYKLLQHADPKNH